MASPIPVDVAVVDQCPYHKEEGELHAELELEVREGQTFPDVACWFLVVYCLFGNEEVHPLYRARVERAQMNA